MPLTIAEDRIDFAGLLRLLYQQKFTGAIILNFRGGVPKVVEVPSVQIRLESGLDTAPALSAL